MSITTAAVLIGALTLPGLPNPTQLQIAQCDKRSEIVETLGKRFGEATVGAGLTSGYLLEILANPETGSWTMIRTAPTGMSCIVSAGHSWESMAFIAPGAAL